MYISLKLVPNGPVDNIPALVQVMAWCQPGDKPLSFIFHSLSNSLQLSLSHGGR